LIVEVNAPSEVEGFFSAKLVHTESKQWMVVARVPGRELPLWLPRGHATLEVRWHRGEDMATLLTQEVLITDSTTPQRIAVTLSAKDSAVPVKERPAPDKD